MEKGALLKALDAQLGRLSDLQVLYQNDWFTDTRTILLNVFKPDSDECKYFDDRFAKTPGSYQDALNDMDKMDKLKQTQEELRLFILTCQGIIRAN
jgi:hypothetical protein